MDLAALSFDELRRLREAVQRVHMQYYPAEFFTDREADRIIETFGEEAAQRLVKKLVDGRLGE